MKNFFVCSGWVVSVVAMVHFAVQPFQSEYVKREVAILRPLVIKLEKKMVLRRVDKTELCKGCVHPQNGSQPVLLFSESLGKLYGTANEAEDIQMVPMLKGEGC